MSSPHITSCDHCAVITVALQSIQSLQSINKNKCLLWQTHCVSPDSEHNPGHDSLHSCSSQTHAHMCVLHNINNEETVGVFPGAWICCVLACLASTMIKTSTVPCIDDVWRKAAEAYDLVVTFVPCHSCFHCCLHASTATQDTLLLLPLGDLS